MGQLYPRQMKRLDEAASERRRTCHGRAGLAENRNEPPACRLQMLRVGLVILRSRQYFGNRFDRTPLK